MAGTVLITGVTGQDGFYLASEFVNSGFKVIGTTRSIAKGAAKLNWLSREVELVEWDLVNKASFRDLLRSTRPDRVYNLAAFTSGQFMDRQPEFVTDINGTAVLRILEAIKDIDTSIRFCQASSSEVFAASGVSPQSEVTPMLPRSVYGAAKAYADSIVRIYREKYGLFACSAFLFNHESSRRDEGFVSQKIVRAAVRIKLGRQSKLMLGNLDAVRDWGFAGDFARALKLILSSEVPQDFVVATGETHSVRELCEIAFGTLGLDYRDYVFSDQRHYRASESIKICGDSKKIKNELNWVPLVPFADMLKLMVDDAMLKEKLN